MPAIAPRVQLVASLVLAAAGLLVFSTAGGDILGLPPGFAGSVLFFPGAWSCAHAIARLPRGDGELLVAPREWQAWIGLAFVSALLLSIVATAGLFAAHVPVGANPEARAAGRVIGGMLVAWVVLAAVLRHRWRGSVLEDERAVQMARRASDWGRGTTVAGVVAVAVLLAFSPTTRLQQYSYPWIAQLLMPALLAGAWVDHAMAAWLYWRDRGAPA
jgi:uncharacterized membrane protein